MPRIRPYEQQLSAEQGMPSQRAQGSDFGGPGLAQFGHALVGAGQDIGYAQRILQANYSRKAVTDVYTFFSNTRALFTKRAHEIELQADPANAADAWKQFAFGDGDEDAPSEGSLKHYLDAYGAQIEDPEAQQVFQRQAAHLTEQFSNHFVTVQARLEGAYAQQQAIQLVNGAQTTVLTDPSQYSSVLTQTMAAIDDPRSIYGRLPADKREKIKRQVTEQIASSAVRGMIREAPAHAKHSLSIGEWDYALSGEEKAVLLSAADQAIHAQDVAARQADAERRRQLEELRHQTDRNLTAKYFLHLDNPGNPQFPPVTATEVAHEMAAGRLDGAVGRALINMMEADAKERTLKSDNSTYWELFRRITLPWGHPDKLTSVEEIYTAAANRRLTPSNVKQLTADFDKARSEEGLSILKAREIFLSSVKSSITHSNPLLGKLDQEGDINFGRLTQLAIAEEAKAMKENRDPHEIYDETSKYYLGNKLGNYRKSLKQSLDTISRSLKAKPAAEPTKTVPARLPGETPQQYFDRIKK